MQRIYLLFSVTYLLCGWTGLLWADSPYKRIHLSSFRAIWADRDLEARSHLEMGVEELFKEDQCKILSPLEPVKPEEKAWQPLDFYTQVEKSEVEKFKPFRGRPNVFFAGDDFNRNKRQDEHLLTRVLADTVRDCLTFVDVRKAKDRVEVVVNFIRGELNFEGVFAAEVLRNNQGCDGRLSYCEESEGEGKNRFCKKGKWTKRVIEIRAVADQAGFLSDRFSTKTLRPREKNDVYSLVAQVVGREEEPNSKNFETIILATKAKEKDKKNEKK